MSLSFQLRWICRRGRELLCETLCDKTSLSLLCIAKDDRAERKNSHFDFPCISVKRANLVFISIEFQTSVRFCPNRDFFPFFFFQSRFRDSRDALLYTSRIKIAEQFCVAPLKPDRNVLPTRKKLRLLARQKLRNNLQCRATYIRGVAYSDE